MVYILHDAFDYRFRYNFHKQYCATIDEITEDDIKKLKFIGYIESYKFSIRKFKKNHGVFIQRGYIYNIEDLEEVIEEEGIPSTYIIKCGNRTEDFLKLPKINIRMVSHILNVR